MFNKKRRNWNRQEDKKSREEFSKGFVKGASFSLPAYYLYSLAISAAYAADSNVPVTLKIPGDTGVVQPAPASKPKPGFKTLSEGTKSAYVGWASAICGPTLQSGDFFLGIACAFLLVVEGVVINRP